MNTKTTIYSSELVDIAINDFFDQDQQYIQMFKKTANVIYQRNDNIVVRGNNEIIGVSEPGYRYVFYILLRKDGYHIKFCNGDSVLMKICTDEWLENMSVSTFEMMTGNSDYRTGEGTRYQIETKEEKNTRLLLSIDTLISGVNPETGEQLEKDNIIYTRTILDLLSLAKKQLDKEKREIEKKNGLISGEWTAEEDRQLEGMIDEGLTTYQISKKLNRSSLSVFYRLKKLGLLLQKSPVSAVLPSATDEESIAYSDEELLEFLKNNASEPVRLTCEKCKLFRNESCAGMGNPATCLDFDPAPDVSKEELELWPKYGTATIYKLKKQNDGHHELS